MIAWKPSWKRLVSRLIPPPPFFLFLRNQNKFEGTQSEEYNDLHIIHFKFDSNVWRFLFQHEKALHALSNALLEYETLSAEEIKRILLPYREGQLPDQQDEVEQQEGDLVLAWSSMTLHCHQCKVPENNRERKRWYYFILILIHNGGL